MARIWLADSKTARSKPMAATGLEVFDKTLQTTNTWLDEVMETTGPDRHVAWHALTAVLHTLRDRLPVDLSAHLGAQLPLLIRGAYYDQWHPAGQPERVRSADEFLERVGQEMANTRPVNLRDTTEGVFGVIGRHVTAGQAGKVREALPEPVRALWPQPDMAAHQPRP
jgi:uncharacterized protein (DUF2267 family)